MEPVPSSIESWLQRYPIIARNMGLAAVFGKETQPADASDQQATLSEAA